MANSSARLRVLVNALSARLGGGQTYLNSILRFVPDDLLLEIHVLASKDLHIPPVANVRRVDLNWPVENPFPRALWERIALKRLLRQIRADVLFCPGGVSAIVPPPACKSVTMFRNMVPFDMAQRRRYPLGYMRVRHALLRPLLLRSMKKADLVICISEFARRVIEKQCPELAPKTVVIPHGVSPEFRDCTIPRPKWLPTQNYFLYVSILDVYKAQVEVVRAYDLLRKRRPTSEKLLLVGPERSDYAGKVRDEIQRLGLAEHVLLPGPVPHNELPAVYRHALVNIFASECENCPNILLEALAAGRPVLSSDCPPMTEFGGPAAIYFDPRNPLELAEKLGNVLDDPSRLEVLAALAEQRSRLFDWRRTARLTWTAIHNVARPAAARAAAGLCVQASS
jgi:glycosyltransferase involved in cell wall biosynthesis